MTAPALKRPSIDLVAPSWLRLVPAIEADRVATSLPKDVTPLRTGSFITVSSVGGTPNVDVPLRQPAVRCSAWAAPAATGSTQVPWGRASDAAEAILDGTYVPELMGVLIDLTSRGYAPARVLTVVALSEPTRVEGDPSGFARYDIDLLMNWRTD